MDWFTGILSILLFCLLIFIFWRYHVLRQRLGEYNRLIRRSIEAVPDLSMLPPDLPGLEDLSNAVKNLGMEFTRQLSSVTTDRTRLASILEQMTDGVIIANADGLITFINPAAGRMLETKSALGHRVVEVLRHYQLVEAWQRCQATLVAQDETVEITAQHTFLHMVALPDSQTSGVLLLLQDLTPLRRLESVRRDFISNVSHELRTPLASLKALTETLQDGALADAEAAPRFLGRMEKEVDALIQMTQELLDLSRIESGQVNLEFLPVDPSQLLHSCAERMRAQAERAGLNITIAVPPDLPRVRADSARLEQVLVNLLHNAIKFSPVGGMLTLSAAREDGFVRFSVTDTGQGIAEEDLERVFERFYKSDRARSGGGTGLGLSISRHIIQAHGGSIWAESREGRGSTFHFSIPVS